MKTALCLFSLLFTLVCHAQRWELNVPVPTSGNLTNSGVFADGAGGGAILVRGDNVIRCVWFSAAGVVLATNDVIAPFLSGDNPQSYLNVVRVTPKALDLEAVIVALGTPSATLRRFSKGQLHETPLLIAETARAERVSSLATIAPDKRGFFTTQISGTNVIVRRYTF
ncbi:MAG TPA: hypothetical protein VGF13_20675 [Verrucomicrobiae bacterium]|jgi:hypothetical protein